MLDASNPGGHRPKKGMQSRPVDPFWTGSAAASVSPAGPTQATEAQENHPGQRGTHRDGGNDEDRGGDMSDFESVGSPGDTALHDWPIFVYPPVSSGLREISWQIKCDTSPRQTFHVFMIVHAQSVDFYFNLTKKVKIEAKRLIDWLIDWLIVKRMFK